MFRNRCCDRPMAYSSETSFKYADGAMPQEYPQAVPIGGMMPGGMAPGMMGMGQGCMIPPVYECPQERVCNREFMHEVPHIVPINTRVINHHVYRHSYTPCYTCCEENVVSNVYDGCPGNF